MTAFATIVSYPDMNACLTGKSRTQIDLKVPCRDTNNKKRTTVLKIRGVDQYTIMAIQNYQGE